MVTNLVDHLVWPVTTFAIALIFRKEFAGLIRRIERMTGPVGLSLETSVGKLSAATDQLNATKTDATGEGDQPYAAFRSVAHNSPREAIIACHTLLAAHVSDELAKQTGLRPKYTSPSAMTAMMSAGGVLRPGDAAALQATMDLAQAPARDALNGAEVTVAQALEYVESIEGILGFFDDALSRGQASPVHI